MTEPPKRPHLRIVPPPDDADEPTDSPQASEDAPPRVVPLRSVPPPPDDPPRGAA